MPEIDFPNIRTHESSKNEGFEELCCQLLALTPPEQGARWIRKRGAGGDNGVEGYWKLGDGSEHAIQSKYFFEFGNSQRRQLSDSIDSMLAGHPQCLSLIHI